MQRARVREPAEQTMQRFLSRLSYQIRRIVHHHQYNDMAQLLHQVREAEASLADEAKFPRSTTTRSRFPSWTSSAGQPTVGTRDAASVGGSKAPSAVKSGAPAAKSTAQPAMSGSGSTNSTARNRDMLCHTCGGKGHFKRECPNKKVMLIDQETNECETGDDADPFDEEDDDPNDTFFCDPSTNPTLVCTQRVLQVAPSPHEQRCNLFQTKADVGNGKACKVIIDGGSCQNLASKELCTKLKLKYYPHPSPYCISWLSDVGEIKVTKIGRAHA